MIFLLSVQLAILHESKLYNFQIHTGKKEEEKKR